MINIDIKGYASVLTDVCRKDGRPYESALSDFLDFLIRFHDVSIFATAGGFAKNVCDAMAAHPEYVNLALIWYNDVANAMDKGEALDVFGMLYEDLYLSKGKASATGQFFTPMNISSLMADITDNGQTEGKVNDCACGSGRLLIAHYMKVSREDHSAGRKFEYVANDVDPIACKMCALNFMIHGMNGTVACQNTLSQEPPSVVYHINEVRYPISTPYYSIRAEIKNN